MPDPEVHEEDTALLAVVVVAILMTVAVVMLLVLNWRFLVVHLSQELGISNSSSRAYSWWSGAGSDVTELAILFSLVHVFRHTNCHVKRCWRFGKPVDHTAYRAC